MGKIEWTEETWNPTRGCKLISPGCANCYAMKQAHRFSGHGKPYAGLTRLRTKGGPVWTGEFREVPDMLDVPLRKRSPTTFFVNSMSDLFGEDVSDEFIAAVFGVMAATQQHTYQVLTKRAERLPEWSRWASSQRGLRARSLCSQEASPLVGREWDFANPHGRWPPPNVWLGVSVEDRKHGRPRIEHLRRTPAAVRFLSIEPLLEDIGELDLDGIHWVIVGGESGAGAREMRPEWVRSVLEQCQRERVPFFFKQWGGVQKRKHGRLLDGRTWDEMPTRSAP